MHPLSEVRVVGLVGSLSRMVGSESAPHQQESLGAEGELRCLVGLVGFSLILTRGGTDNNFSHICARIRGIGKNPTNPTNPTNPLIRKAPLMVGFKNDPTNPTWDPTKPPATRRTQAAVERHSSCPCHRCRAMRRSRCTVVYRARGRCQSGARGRCPQRPGPLQR
jgi:hypothetical protein